MTLTVAPTGRHFLRDGQPFFYLADTIWSAFTNPTVEEWREYLVYRRRQGFNVLQITVLPVLHDFSASDQNLVPFELDAAGRWDFFRPSPAYFARAEMLVEMARAEGFVPALVVLWCDYVPGAWANRRFPEMAMPRAALDGYVAHVAHTFARFDPIFVISGDTDFEAPDPTEYYSRTLDEINRLCPDALTTLHLAPQADLPGRILQSPHLAFYMFQSGHHLEEQARTYTLAERFAGKPVRRPVVNGEPCYEGHGHGHRYGRFSAVDVRRAIWQSLLSGAGAGVTYGAHGVWSWHRRGKAFSSEAFSMLPFDWHEALRLEGAWDAGFARTLVERYGLVGLDSRQDLLSGPEALRAAASSDMGRVAVFVPYPTEVVLAVDPAAYTWTLVDLSARRWETAPVSEREGKTMIAMHEANSDTLVIGEGVRG